MVQDAEMRELVGFPPTSFDVWLDKTPLYLTEANSKKSDLNVKVGRSLEGITSLRRERGASRVDSSPRQVRSPAFCWRLNGQKGWCCQGRNMILKLSINATPSRWPNWWWRCWSAGRLWGKRLTQCWSVFPFFVCLINCHSLSISSTWKVMEPCVLRGLSWHSLGHTWYLSRAPRAAPV